MLIWAAALSSSASPEGGGGRSGGIRTIVLFRRGELAFFVYGFAKSGRENLRRDELKAFRLLADEYLVLDRTGLSAVGAIIEVQCDDPAVQE
ncbi:MAG: type II toxin-antitoxin system RelE/ParE family toxin [Bryobacterales bacterium]|nr:type II toxin-antitoxin system RelE/ParE family toxin [Bryobacterales bacterium]